MIDLSELPDDPEAKLVRSSRSVYAARRSPRLATVLSKLPKQNRVRIMNTLDNEQILTLQDLCAKKLADMWRWKNFGKRSIEDLVRTLALFGLSIQGAEPVRTLDVHVQELQRWMDDYLKQLEVLVDARATHERDILKDVMLILDGRPPTLRQEYTPAPIKERCSQIADVVVPTFRCAPGGRCTRPTAKRWQAAWEGACLAFGHSPKEFA